jgi:hypothetical protein
MTTAHDKTLGQVIDEILTALRSLDEGDRSIAVQAACDHLKISGPFPSQVDNSLSGAGIGSNAEAASRSMADIRTLKEEKQPKTATEMACTVGYYLDTLALPALRKEEIGSSDIEMYFKQAGYPLPKRKEQVLVDAKAAGYFDSAGHGKYRLNPVGHNLIVHTLPRVKK